MSYYWQQNKKLSRKTYHISKIVLFGEFLGSLLSKIADPLRKVAVLLAKNILPLLGTMALLQQQEVKRKYLVLEQ